MYHPFTLTFSERKNVTVKSRNKTEHRYKETHIYIHTRDMEVGMQAMEVTAGFMHAEDDDEEEGASAWRHRPCLRFHTMRFSRAPARRSFAERSKETFASAETTSPRTGEACS